MMRAFSLPLLAVLALLAASCRSTEGKDAVNPEEEARLAAEDAEELLIIGPVLTMDTRRGTVEAMLLRHGAVKAVGELERVRALTRPGAVELVLPEGAAVMPGITESHAHLLGIGEGLARLDLRGTRSAEEVVARVRAALPKLAPGEWLEGRGWNQELWSERRFPDRRLLDAVAPEVPVLLTRVDGHASWVNTAALRLAGINRDTPSPPGGEILRRPDGEPTGVLVDNAMGLVSSRRPPREDVATLTRDILAAQELALSLGITSLVDAGTDPLTLRVLDALEHDGRLKMRVHAMHSASSLDDVRRITAEPPRLERGRHRLSARAIKMYADGALGSRGAWLLEPYADRPGHVGLPVTPPSVLREAASLAMKSGYQLCVHAIGDRANREVLDAIAEALMPYVEAEKPLPDHRFRIEHAQIVHPDDQPRFGRLGVIPSMQTCHAASDARMALARLGEKRRRTSGYVWRNLLDHTHVLPNGTDAPVEELSPWRNLYTACFRRNPGSDDAFDLEQRLTRMEALLSMTAWGAHGVFAETARGRLTPGLDADFIVLDRNPLTCEPEELSQIRVLGTFIQGEPVFGRAPGDLAPAASTPLDATACGFRIGPYHPESPAGVLHAHH